MNDHENAFRHIGIHTNSIQYTNSGFLFSVKSQCSLVSNLLNQPIRFLYFPAYPRNRQDILGPRRFFKDGRQAPDWSIEHIT